MILTAVLFAILYALRYIIKDRNTYCIAAILIFVVVFLVGNVLLRRR